MWDSNRSLSFSLSLSGSCSFGFFIIPLICCAPVQDHTTVCRFFFFFLSFLSMCARVSVAFFPLFRRRRRGMSDSRVLLVLLLFLLFDIYFLFVRSRSQAVWRAPCCAALIFTGRGHYQLIDYFDCCYLIPHRPFVLQRESQKETENIADVCKRSIGIISGGVSKWVI